MAEDLARGNDWPRRRGNQPPEIQMSTGYPTSQGFGLRKGRGDEQENLPKGDARIAPCFRACFPNLAEVGRVTPCAPQVRSIIRTQGFFLTRPGAHGVTRPTF